MVCVKVSFLFVELRFLTDVDNGLAQTFRVTGLPIRTTVIMSKVSNDELRVSNLDAHDIVDDTCRRDIMQCDEIATGGLLHYRFYNLLNKVIQIRIVELHGDETVVSIEPPTVKGGVNLDHFGGAKVDQLVKG